MPRIEIAKPPAFGFHTELAIYDEHINIGGHLDNARLLGLVSEARQRYFKSMGYTQLDVEGVGIIVADAAVRYRSEAFHGETLSFAMQAWDFNKYGCDLLYEVTERDSGRLVAEGKTGIVFFDYTARKPAAVPPAFRAKTGG